MTMWKAVSLDRNSAEGDNGQVQPAILLLREIILFFSGKSFLDFQNSVIIFSPLKRGKIDSWRFFLYPPPSHFEKILGEM